MKKKRNMKDFMLGGPVKVSKRVVGPKTEKQRQCRGESGESTQGSTVWPTSKLGAVERGIFCAGQ